MNLHRVSISGGPRYLLALFIFLLAGMPSMAANIVSTTPAQNELNVAVSSNISVTFDEGMDETTINNSTVYIHSISTGPHSATFAYDSPSHTVTINPDNDFMAGEIVSVMLTTGIEDISGMPLANAFGWSFTIDVVGGYGNFFPDGSYQTSNYTHAVRAADFDSDGDLDLAAATTLGGIYIFTNIGGSVFESTIVLPQKADDIFAADFDGDFDIDLAWAYSLDQVVGVYINDGSGQFSIGTPTSVNYYLQYLDAADFDGDGDLDIVINHQDDDKITVLFNNGEGVFLSGTAYPVSDSPFDVCAADFDNDGLADIAVAKRGSDDLGVLINQGEGTFAPEIGYSIGQDIQTITTADLNADGYLDVISANPIDYTISVLFNQGDGTFVHDSDYDIIDRPWSVSALDFDGDGDLDLATANFDISVSLLLNQGNGSFVFAYKRILDTRGYSIISADINNDSDVDLIMTGPSAVSIISYGLCQDTDNDGWGNPGVPTNECPVDNCPLAYNPNQADLDADGIGDACDECTDTDGDGYGNPGFAANTCPDDNCPDIYNIDQTDSDYDGLGDICDNCVYASNPDQKNLDGDEYGDACDDDKDGDGINNDVDNCPDVFNSDQEDSDGDGIGDFCAIGGNGVYTDIVLSTDNTIKPDTLFVRGNYKLRVWIGNDFVLGGFSLGFRIYSDDGVTWQWIARPEGLGSMEAVTVYPNSRLGYPDGWTMDMTKLIVTERSTDGISPDTIMIGGVAMRVGLPTGYLAPQAVMHFSPFDMPGDTGTLCIDSTFVPPSGAFVFVDPFGQPPAPYYGGPFCWPVLKRMILGDFDLDGQITIGDVVDMIAVIFKGKLHPYPDVVGDANCDGNFNVGDAIYMINYIFKFGPPPGCE